MPTYTIHGQNQYGDVVAIGELEFKEGQYQIPADYVSEIDAEVNDMCSAEGDTFYMGYQRRSGEAIFWVVHKSGDMASFVRFDDLKFYLADRY